ncbi:MAG: hypothetical protein EXR74_03130 [Bdellovibrionales bacterium]|nr:hypothetical protein [Bdellovibrionales bacterium]
MPAKPWISQQIIREVHLLMLCFEVVLKPVSMPVMLRLGGLVVVTGFSVRLMEPTTTTKYRATKSYKVSTPFSFFIRASDQKI